MVKKPKKDYASQFTGIVATWKFVFITLAVCVVEIWWNHTSLVPTKLQFDDTMLTLNTMLSLWAAIQSSIIMIDSRIADKKRDHLLVKIDHATTRLDKLEKERSKDANTPSNR